MSGYPVETRERDAWILARRPLVSPADPWRPQGAFLEAERAASGEMVSVLTILLTGSACPWRCLMCDLWRHASAGPTPAGALPAQIELALAQGGASARAAGHVKLYNGSSFFLPRAVPPRDYAEIAQRLAGFQRVIVESHPALVGDRCWRFRDELLKARSKALDQSGASPELEVAMGLETAHPEVLAKLNKRMALPEFERAAGRLRREGIALRVFILVRPPFLEEPEALAWAVASVKFAFDCGAAVAVLIPTRGGNGALESLAASGQFTPPRLASLETALEASLALGRGRVFADLWDLERLSDCPACFPARRQRLREMNFGQTAVPRVRCSVCG